MIDVYVKLKEDLQICMYDGNFSEMVWDCDKWPEEFSFN